MKKRRKHWKEILRTWDDPVLRKVCEPVGDNEDVTHIIRDMLYILTNSKSGVGIAAPQVGYAKRIIAVGSVIMINPELIESGFEKETKIEGCLSYPGIYIPVERWIEISIEYETEIRYTQKNARSRTRWITGKDARIFQHELDHLDGKCAVRNK